MNTRFALVLVLVALAGCTTPREFDPESSRSTLPVDAGAPALQPRVIRTTPREFDPESSRSTPPVDAPAPASQPRVIRITAKRFEYSPSKVVLEKGEPVVLELVSLDRKHGFAARDLGLRTDIEPDHVTRLELTPKKAGTFEFHCDVFCGSGHEGMEGEIVVEEK